MNNTFGYNPLSYELIDLFRSGAPDFEAAEDLIRRGADVNDQGDDKSENVLSEIIFNYCASSSADGMQEECRDCHKDYVRCSGCEHNLNPELGAAILQVIRFFLDHGFDVGRNEGRHGAQCLYALTLSTFDGGMIDATKLLLDAGAKNIPIEDDPYETPMTFIGEEGSYQDTSEHNHYLGNIFEAVYQIYVALENGKPYSGIDSFECAVGKRILRVMADADSGSNVFTSIDEPTSKHDNCFLSPLYFFFDCGYLVCTKEAGFWTNNTPLDKAAVDVSQFFPNLIGARIDKITFDHNEIIKERTHYGQPVTTFHMDNGTRINFTINFGEVEKKDYCAYYYY